MVNEFSGAEMFISSQGIMSLKAVAVVVFGAGDVGSHTIEALARYGIGRLVLVDNDTVPLINISRQSIAMYSATGWSRIQVMKEKIADLSPDTQVIISEQFVSPQSLDTLFETIKSQMEPSGHVSYILDIADTVTTELALIPYAQKNRIPIISSMGAGNKLHPELLNISDISQIFVCPLRRVTYEELKTRSISHLGVCWFPELPLTPGPAEGDTGNRRAIPGNISFVPSVAGLLIAGQIVRDICGLN